MGWIYTMFEWTFHLSTLGEILWGLFLGLTVLFRLGYVFWTLSGVKSPTMLSFLFMFFVPEIAIFVVGAIGYFITT